VEEKKYKQFSVSLSGERKDLISVNKADFPITIRNARTSDKKVNKLFKDKKIPLFERRSWPVIVDKNGVVILVLKLDILYNEKVTLKDEKIRLYIRESEDTNEFK
jgi:tRNA(Ile)-lysidine synthetase-like protein